MYDRTAYPSPARRGALVPWALAASALLSACASLAPPNTALPDVPVPARWTSTAAATVKQDASAMALAQWWERFNDPVLTALVTRSLQANTDLRGAQAALQQARAQRDVQAASLGPTLGARFDMDHGALLPDLRQGWPIGAGPAGFVETETACVLSLDRARWRSAEWRVLPAQAGFKETVPARTIPGHGV